MNMRSEHRWSAEMQESRYARCVWTVTRVAALQGGKLDDTESLRAYMIVDAASISFVIRT